MMRIVVNKALLLIVLAPSWAFAGGGVPEEEQFNLTIGGTPPLAPLPHQYNKNIIKGEGSYYPTQQNTRGKPLLKQYQNPYPKNEGHGTGAPLYQPQYNKDIKGEGSYYPTQQNTRGKPLLRRYETVTPSYHPQYYPYNSQEQLLDQRDYYYSKGHDNTLWKKPSPAMYEAINKMNPIPPSMIRLQQRKLDETAKARGYSFRPIKKKTRSIVYGSSNNQFNDRVFVFQGHSSTLVFLDSFGSPWEVQRFIVGNELAYDVIMDKTKENAHILTLRLKRKFVPSNLTILLKGRSVPIVLDLDSDNQQIDSLVTITSSGASEANRKESQRYSEDLLIDVTSNMAELVPFLDNTPPDNAIVVSVLDGLETNVWYWNSRFICRTKGKLTNPVPLGDYSQMTSNDGVWTVYDLGLKIPPIFSILNGSGEFKQAIVAVDEVI